LRIKEALPLKPLHWVGSSKDDFCSFPKEVMKQMGYALYLAQSGDKHPSAKPLKGFGGAGVLEIAEDDHRGTYRAVYTVRFPQAVYVLHAFQKKSKRGIKTPAQEMKLVEARLRLAEQDYRREKQGK
jgi:phage-related protein